MQCPPEENLISLWLADYGSQSSCRTERLKGFAVARATLVDGRSVAKGLTRESSSGRKPWVRCSGEGNRVPVGQNESCRMGWYGKVLRDGYRRPFVFSFVFNY